MCSFSSAKTWPVTKHGADATGKAPSQNAINSLIGRAKPGDTLFFPKGVFKITSPIACDKNNLTFTGNGTIRQGAPCCHCMEIHSNGVKVTKLNFMGFADPMDSCPTCQSGAMSDIIVMAGANNCLIDSVCITNSLGGGITVKNTSKLASANANIISNCSINNVSGNGVLITGEGFGNANNNVVKTNYINGTVGLPTCKPPYKGGNCILLTANSVKTDTSSPDAKDTIYNNSVLNNALFNCAVSPIESAYHTVGSIMESNNYTVLKRQISAPQDDD